MNLDKLLFYIDLPSHYHFNSIKERENQFNCIISFLNSFSDELVETYHSKVRSDSLYIHLETFKKFQNYLKRYLINEMDLKNDKGLSKLINRLKELSVMSEYNDYDNDYERKQELEKLINNLIDFCFNKL